MLAPETTLVLAKMGVDVIAVSADDSATVLGDLWKVRTGNYVHIVVANRRGQEGIFHGGYRASPSQATGEGTSDDESGHGAMSGTRSCRGSTTTAPCSRGVAPPTASRGQTGVTRRGGNLERARPTGPYLRTRRYRACELQPRTSQPMNTGSRTPHAFNDAGGVPSSSARPPPPRRPRLGLGAEPTLAARRVDPGPLVELPSGDVVDPAPAPTDVPLDPAA